MGGWVGSGQWLGDLAPFPTSKLPVPPPHPPILPPPQQLPFKQVEEVVTVARAASAATDGAAPAEPHIDLSTYTGAPPPAECQLDEALFRRAEPYEGRRWVAHSSGAPSR